MSPALATDLYDQMTAMVTGHWVSQTVRARRRPVARRSSLWAEAHGGRGGRTGRQRPEYHLPADAGVGGDFFEAVPAADLYLLKFILHGWDDENCVKILSRCREAMLPGGRLAVISWF